MFHLKVKNSIMYLSSSILTSLEDSQHKQYDKYNVYWTVHHCNSWWM